MTEITSREVNTAAEANIRTAQREKPQTELPRDVPRELRGTSDRGELREVPLGRRIDERVRDSGEQRRVFCAPRVEGFERSGVMSNEEVKHYLEQTFPDRHCNNITMENVRYSDQYLATDKDVELGHWQDTKPYPGMDIHEKDIIINSQTREGIVDKEILKDTIAHEVGHQVHKGYVDGSDWNDWDRLSGNRPPEQCVSEYAQKDAREDFAESYMSYVRNPERLKEASPEKYEFMRDRAFGGREYTASEATLE